MKNDSCKDRLLSQRLGLQCHLITQGYYKVNVINKNGALYWEKLCTNVYLEISFLVTFVPYLVCIALSQTRSANASNLWNVNQKTNLFPQSCAIVVFTYSLC